MRIELLASPGCPHAAAAKEIVADCLATLGIDEPIVERVGRYPSPTVLVDGVDVMRLGRATPTGDACRLDLPTRERVLNALRVARGRSLMHTTVRLLAHGRPVTLTELADAVGADAVDLANAPAGYDIEYDDEHRIVGWGLTLIPTPHNFIVDGRRLYTWCAADTLLFPPIIGKPARIESRCPATDTVISLTVDPQAGVTDLSPATAMISIPDSRDLDATRVRTTCCNSGRFFANAEVTADWLASYPTGTVLPVADAYPRLRPLGDWLVG
ncbi:organomercurial lyase MerB [Mycobacterium hubeiense]|uniref:organomercurial lyase MerB n=1 Tax=Mycobacterium hubeiense TaxID=1867256 RepID=UPI0018ECE2C2|nr:organomercurial lyase MerB [Mycobacterium sp. QGD 101]